MTPSIRRKLEALAERHEEVGRLLAEPDAMADPRRFRDLSREYAQLQPVTDSLASFDAAHRDLAAAEAMRADPELREFADEEVASHQQRLAVLDAELQLLLLPKDPRDEANLYLEVRAGTGGDEAAIFAGDLFRMYARYAERKRWLVEILSASDGEHGGYKEIIARIEGAGAYSKLKFSACRIPNPRAASTPRLRPSRSCRKWTRSRTSRSTRRTSRSTHSALPAQAASTSTRPIPRSA
jgi:peptide chain release factor 1